MRADIDVRTPFAALLLAISSVPNSAFPSFLIVDFHVNIIQLLSFTIATLVAAFKIREYFFTTKLRKEELKRAEESETLKKSEFEFFEAVKKRPTKSKG